MKPFFSPKHYSLVFCSRCIEGPACNTTYQALNLSLGPAVPSAAAIQIWRGSLRSTMDLCGFERASGHGRELKFAPRLKHYAPSVPIQGHSELDSPIAWCSLLFDKVANGHSSALWAV